MEERTTMMVQAIAREPALLMQVDEVPCDHSRDSYAAISSECDERTFAHEPVLSQHLKVLSPLFNVSVKIWKWVFAHSSHRRSIPYGVAVIPRPHAEQRIHRYAEGLFDSQGYFRGQGRFAIHQIGQRRGRWTDPAPQEFPSG
jgi:hypothetical protein